MYHHIKKLMYTVNVGTPDPRFGNMLLEQFGGANGELAAAMQYSIQGLNCDDLERKDMLMDIGTEELSHLEVVGTLARMHLKPMKRDRDSAEADPLIAIAGGGEFKLSELPLPEELVVAATTGTVTEERFIAERKPGVAVAVTVAAF